MPIDYGSNDVTTSGNFVASSGNFTTALTVNNVPVATGTSISITNATDNRVLTSSNTGGGINAESNLTFNGTTLAVTGVIDIDNLRLDGNTISSTNSNGNIIIQPSGTGPLQATSTGNIRGSFSVDWQRARFLDTQVANGSYSVIGGGQSNTSSGANSTVGGGRSNTSSGYISTVGGGQSNYSSGFYSTIGGGLSNWSGGIYSTIGGGLSNISSGSFSTVGGGRSNISSGSYSTVGGGYRNTSSGNYSTVGGGRSNSSSGNCSTVGGGLSNSSSGYFSTVGGGRSNIASGAYSVVSGGLDAVASLHGEEAKSSGKFNIDGDAQTRKFILRNRSQGSSFVNLYLNGISSEIIIPENCSWFYSIKVIARNADDIETAAYEFKGAIERSNLVTIALGDLKTVLHEDNEQWDCDINIIDDEILRITTICDIDQNFVYWVAYAEIVQVIVPSTVPSYS